MKMDLIGRLRHTKLPSSRHLLPLFEAIINSIHAIDDATVQKGRIDVTIEREPIMIQSGPDGQEPVGLPPIIGYRIKDNGIGFNKENMDSFLTADSRRKIERGGKGVGRFLWLVAFQKAEIESVYEENGERRKLTFNFVLSDEGIVDEKREKTMEDVGTSVRLRYYKHQYADRTPKTVQAIASVVSQAVG